MILGQEHSNRASDLKGPYPGSLDEKGIAWATPLGEEHHLYLQPFPNRDRMEVRCSFLA